MQIFSDFFAKIIFLALFFHINCVLLGILKYFLYLCKLNFFRVRK